MEEINSPKAAAEAWVRDRVGRMTPEEKAKFRGDLLFFQLKDIYELLEKLEERDRAGSIQNTKIFSMTQTKIRKFPQGDLILLFPEVAFNSELILSWQFIGEHGGASPNLIHELPLATAKEKEEIIDAYEKLYCCKVQDLERDRAKEVL